MAEIRKTFSSFTAALLTMNFVIAGTAAAVSPDSFNPKTEKAYIFIDDEDLSAVPVSMILENLLDSGGRHIELPDGEKLLCSYDKSDDYFSIDKESTLDLSAKSSFEMLTGDRTQLNHNNKRYVVTVRPSEDIKEIRTYELYTQDENGKRRKVEPENMSDRYADTYIRQLLVPEHEDGTEYYLGISSPMDEHPFIRLDVLDYAEYNKYMLAEENGEEYEYSTLNDRILNQDMKSADSGYKTLLDSSDENILCFIYRNEQTNEIIRKDCIKLIVGSGYYSFTDEAYDEQAENVQLGKSKTTIAEDEYVITVNNIRLRKNLSPDAEYYYRLSAYSNSDNADSHVVKAVRGLYRSMEDAAEAEDIKDLLMPSDESIKGYRANYSVGNDVYFTVFFDDDSAYRFKVVFSGYDAKEYSEMPIADSWFRVTGASSADGEKLNTYAADVDSMCGYGYQSVFINEEADSIKPTIWAADPEHISVESVCVNGEYLNVGDPINFPDGENCVNAVFGVVIDDEGGSHRKDYNISFIKKAVGSRLYVAGSDTRPVFFDDYFGTAHDILIANMGDEPLNDLRLELDAENVGLDSYRTIGGENNDTLSASDAAIIRLVPLENPGGDGIINGTLKIFSGEELLKTINLSGRAGNPKIVTPSVANAVLNEPYSQTITTDIMCEWADVKFGLVGDIPSGISFDAETGELSGIPTESGVFTFDIKADFADVFAPSSQTFTLNVMDKAGENEQTAENKVTCSVKIVDIKGKALKNINLELESQPQTAVTGVDGIASFEPVEFGMHTLSLKNTKGEISAQKQFEIVSGESYIIDGDTVTATKGSAITLLMEYNGKELKFTSEDAYPEEEAPQSSSWNRNSAGQNTKTTYKKNTDDTKDTKKNSKESDPKKDSPGTGDNFNILGYMSMIALSLSGIFVSCLGKKSKGGRNKK